jgi:hypothetical protein
MMAYIGFWMAKAATDLLLIICIVLLIFLFAVFRLCMHRFKYRNCKHERVNETQACDAICCNCGRNLGFIETWRSGQPDTTESVK